MPHFRVTVDPPSITVTASALGPDVWPSLRMARAALDDGVTTLISAISSAEEVDIAATKDKAARQRGALRAARKAALKVREADLPSEPELGALTEALRALPVLGVLNVDDPRDPRNAAALSLADTVAEIGRQVEAGATGAGGEKDAA